MTSIINLKTAELNPLVEAFKYSSFGKKLFYRLVIIGLNPDACSFEYSIVINGSSQGDVVAKSENNSYDIIVQCSSPCGVVKVKR